MRASTLDLGGWCARVKSGGNEGGRGVRAVRPRGQGGPERIRCQGATGARVRVCVPALESVSAVRASVQAVIESVEGAEADDEQITKLLAGLEGKVSGGGI